MKDKLKLREKPYGLNVVLGRDEIKILHEPRGLINLRFLYILDGTGKICSSTGITRQLPVYVFDEDKTGVTPFGKIISVAYPLFREYLFRVGIETEDGIWISDSKRNVHWDEYFADEKNRGEIWKKYGGKI
jgi:hypothetical protein